MIKVRIKKPLLKEDGDALDLTVSEKIKYIFRLNRKIAELEAKVRELANKVNAEEDIDTWPELLDACSNLKNSVSGQRTKKK